MKHSKRQLITVMLTFALTGTLLPQTSRAGFSLPSGSASPGHGISNVLSGTVANGALYWQSTTNWLNSGAPTKPYVLNNSFTLPVCDSISAARLVTTVWGGTANYSSQMTVTINGTNLPLANPLVFGTTADTNAIFNATAANAYGAGSGLWLVTLPVPPEMLLKNGAANDIVITQTTPDSFDARIHHVTLLAVYQSSDLANTFNYAIAEGSGDIFKTPSGTQVSQRSVEFAPVNPTNATAATLTALYTYADANSDGLFFNDTQFGGDNAAQWNTSVASYGPSLVSFDVLPNLEAINTIKFTVAAADLTGTPETSLRPQLAALAVTHAAVQLPALALTSAGQLTWPTNAVGFNLETTTDLATNTWTAVTNAPIISGDQYRVTLDLSATQQFYRLKKTN